MNRINRIIAGSSEFASKVLVAGLFLALAMRLGSDFIETRRVTDLLLLVGEGLVVVLTCLRRPAQMIDRRLSARAITTLSLVAPMLLRPSQNTPIVPEAVAAVLAALGLIVVVGGKLSLGCSFGLLPANRGVMVRGLYRFVRHPIYLGYLLTHIPFLAAHPSGWNVAVLLLGDTALFVRAIYEEETLNKDPRYVEYRQMVKWRLVPGLC